MVDKSKSKSNSDDVISISDLLIQFVEGFQEISDLIEESREDPTVDVLEAIAEDAAKCLADFNTFIKTQLTK